MDFKNNDDVYQELAKHDKGEPKWRVDDEMIFEANSIRKHIYNNFDKILWEVPSIESICTVDVE